MGTGRSCADGTIYRSLGSRGVVKSVARALLASEEGDRCIIRDQIYVYLHQSLEIPSTRCLGHA